MAVTIKDVARRANVGVGTVSRVLNGGCVNGETREAVLKIMRELNFTPNRTAHRLRKKRAGVIAVLVPVINHPFFAEFVEAVEEESEKYGWSVIIVSSQQKIKKEEGILEKIRTKEIDGAIFVTHYRHSESELKGFPLVSIDRKMGENIPYVTSNNYDATRGAVEYLLNRGCKKIGFIGTKPVVESEVMLREKAYSDIMEERGLEKRIVYESAMHGEERGIAEKFFKEFLDSDGIFAAGYTIAQEVLAIARERGVNVPEDLQIIAYDGAFSNWGGNRTLTAIEQPVSEMAGAIVKILAEVIEGKKAPQRTVLNAKMVQGDTTEN